MVSCLIIKGFVLCAVKTVSSFYYVMAEKMDVAHVVSLFINILGSDLSALAGYQFAFFSYCAKCRYAIFVAHARQQLNAFQFRLSLRNASENFQLIEDLAYLHSQIAKAFELINAVFSIEVSSEWNF